MRCWSLTSLFITSFALGASLHPCPAGTTSLADFHAEDTDWTACEDLQAAAGAITLISLTETVLLPKTFHPYSPKPDSEYYLGLGKEAVVKSPKDLLGEALLSKKGGPTWAEVESAVPPIRRSGGGGAWCTNCNGLRTFVGSRSSSVDATLNDLGHDCSWVGMPSVQSYVMNLTLLAEGEPPFTKFTDYVNTSAVADGLVGGNLPIVVLYFPLVNGTSRLKPGEGSRYWSFIVSPVPDMKGSREQDVWLRYQQISCAGAGMKPPCKLYGQPAFWDNYWWANAPDGRTGYTGPETPSAAGGFYANLLAVHRYWSRTLADEGMMSLSLPPTHATNGTWLHLQATHAIIRAMITRMDTWHPRYGTTPGYGQNMQNGFQDVFTTTATAAIEWGATPWAKGLIDNQFNFYVRDDGMIKYRAEELPVSARMLTVLALFAEYDHSSAGGDAAAAAASDAFVLTHFKRARALARWLLYRRNASLSYPTDDPRHGVPGGDDEADNFINVMTHVSDQPRGGRPVLHYMSSAAECYRAFLEMGRVWQRIGKAASRADVTSHAEEVLAAAPLVKAALHASLNRTMTKSGPGGNGTQRCWKHTAEEKWDGQMTCLFRTYPEMLYSGALSSSQVDDIYNAATGSADCGARFLTMGSPAAGVNLFTHVPFGLPYGLLQHDAIDKFLLHYFTASAHSYTRGTWTTPESASIDRNRPTIAYASAGVNLAPIYLKWLLAYEEPENRTLWLGKAIPREWLAEGEPPLSAEGVPTRYGRISLNLAAGRDENGDYTLDANATLPAVASARPPPGGVRLRLRAPLPLKLATVTVGGKPWHAFDPEAEAVSFTAADLKSVKVRSGMQRVVASFR